MQRTENYNLICRNKDGRENESSDCLLTGRTRSKTLASKTNASAKGLTIVPATPPPKLKFSGINEQVLLNYSLESGIRAARLFEKYRIDARSRAGSGCQLAEWFKDRHSN